MLLELMLRDEYKKGVLEGKPEEKLKELSIPEFFDPISDELRTFILDLTDNSILTDMLQKAASSHSIVQFIEAISFTSDK